MTTTNVSFTLQEKKSTVFYFHSRIVIWFLLCALCVSSHCYELMMYNWSCIPFMTLFSLDQGVWYPFSKKRIRKKTSWSILMPYIWTKSKSDFGLIWSWSFHQLVLSFLGTHRALQSILGVAIGVWQDNGWLQWPHSVGNISLLSTCLSNVQPIWKKRLQYGQ